MSLHCAEKIQRRWPVTALPRLLSPCAPAAPAPAAPGAPWPNPARHKLRSGALGKAGGTSARGARRGEALIARRRKLLLDAFAREIATHAQDGARATARPRGVRPGASAAARAGGQAARRRHPRHAAAARARARLHARQAAGVAAAPHLTSSGSCPPPPAKISAIQLSSGVAASSCVSNVRANAASKRGATSSTPIRRVGDTSSLSEVTRGDCSSPHLHAAAPTLSCVRAAIPGWARTGQSLRSNEGRRPH